MWQTLPILYLCSTRIRRRKCLIKNLYSYFEPKNPQKTKWNESCYILLYLAYNLKKMTHTIWMIFGNALRKQKENKTWQTSLTMSFKQNSSYSCRAYIQPKAWRKEVCTYLQTFWLTSNQVKAQRRCLLGV